MSFLNRFSETNKKIDPIITWSPWNPVAIKNVDPNVESAIQKGASMYSNPWNIVNTNPKPIVAVREIFALLKFFFNISWWDHVIVTPEDRSKIVFRRGILIGLKDVIETGGHDCPISTVGEILLWKKAQKNEAKNRTSDAINSTIPVFKPFITILEWFPWVVPSRWMSRHHEKATTSIIIKEIKDILLDTLFIMIRPERTIHKAPLEARRGQGLTSTKWKGLNLFIII
jgi:hypothetical protein